MVITDVNQVVYLGDGATTAFPFTFRIIDATDIKLLLIDADGTETDITSDYFVDTVNNTVYYPGYAPGAEPGLADQPAPVQTGQRLVVYRELPVTQEKDLGEKWPFFVIELALDKLTMLIQQVKGIWDRCLKVSVGQEATAPDFNYTVPIEAGKTFRVNNDGTGFELTEDPAVAHAAAVAAQEAAERAQGLAEEARDNAETAADNAEDALDLIKEKATWFDNVAAMKAAAGLQVGMLAGTKGYYSINDGGSSIYAIRAKTQDDVEDGNYIIFLDNGNIAERISHDNDFAYKEENYSETYTVPDFLSRHQAKNEWMEQKQTDATEGTITVATCNVLNDLAYHSLYAGSYIPLAKRNTVVLMTKAQVVGYNEIETNSTVNASVLYAQGVFVDSVFAKAKVNGARGYDVGNLIESAYVCTEKTTGVLTPASGYEDRGYARVVLDVGGKSVAIYSSHLESGSSAGSETLRQQQIAELFTIMGADSVPYRVLMGDMNTETLSNFSIFTNAGYKLVNTGQYKTFDDRKAIDNIIISPNMDIIDSGMISVIYNVPDTHYILAISDHNPLWARLRLN